MKKYSRKNLLGKIARKIYELNQEADNRYTLIINKNGYSIKWLNNIKEITTENLEKTLYELNNLKGVKDDRSRLCRRGGI